MNHVISLLQSVHSRVSIWNEKIMVSNRSLLNNLLVIMSLKPLMSFVLNAARIKAKHER